MNRTFIVLRRHNRSKAAVSDSISETRNSLQLRLPDKSDVDAWDQFVSIYQPLVFRLARSNGFQDADANEFQRRFPE